MSDESKKGAEAWKNHPKLTAEKCELMQKAGVNAELVENARVKMGLSPLQLLEAIEQYGPVAMQVVQYLISQINTAPAK